MPPLTPSSPHGLLARTSLLALLALACNEVDRARLMARSGSPESQHELAVLLLDSRPEEAAALLE